MRSTYACSTAAWARLRCDQCVSARPTEAGSRRAKRSIAWQVRRGKNARTASPGRIVQRGVQAALAIALTHAPNGGRIPSDDFAQRTHTMLSLGTVQHTPDTPA